MLVKQTNFIFGACNEAAEWWYYWGTPPDYGCHFPTWSRHAPMISVASVAGPSTGWFKSTGNISSFVAIDLSNMVLPWEGNRMKWPIGRLGCWPCFVIDLVFKRTTKSCKNMRYDEHKTGKNSGVQIIPFKVWWLNDARPECSTIEKYHIVRYGKVKRKMLYQNALHSPE